MSSGQSQFPLNLEAQRQSAQNPLVRYIISDPLQFMSEPDLSDFTDAHFHDAYKYFSSPEPDRYTYSVCTHVFRNDATEIGEQLLEWGAETSSFRSFPFVFGGSPKKREPRTIQFVESELLNFWNVNSEVLFGKPSRVVEPVLAEQNGLLSVMDRKEVGGFYLYRCKTPTPPALCRSTKMAPRKYSGSFVIAYDVLGGGFYTLNARIKCFTSEHSFMEIIDPNVDPPSIHEMLSSSNTHRMKGLLVLDYHIGDSLSLLTTHATYLSRIPNLDLTIDISRCRFFANERKFLKAAFFKNDGVKIISDVPDYRAFDLIFDPYDLIPGQFAKKPQNDSCSFSILSGLLFGFARKKCVRRDILDIHLSALKYWGVVDQSEKSPCFIEYPLDFDHRKEIRAQYRKKLLRGIKGDRNVILIFPFGLVPERHYPPPRMRAIVEYFYNRGAVIVLAGSEVDTSRIYESTVNISEAMTKGRLKKLAGKKLQEVISAIVASDIVVAMDTGPLHLCRTLRINPIGLYTKKVLNKEQFMRFPWYVDDGTVVQLHPDKGDPHVSVKSLIGAIEDRIDNMFTEAS